MNDDNVTTEMLQNVSTQHNVVADVGPTARLQPLGPVALLGGVAPCRFTRGDGVPIFIASSQGGAARINGATRNLRAEGVVNATGGFFRDREIGISIGVEPGGMTRIVVTNRITEAREEATGTWACA